MKVTPMTDDKPIHSQNDQGDLDAAEQRLPGESQNSSKLPLFKSFDKATGYWSPNDELALSRPDLAVSEVSDFPGYMCCEVLDQGGMGLIYLAFEKATQRWVVLKTLRPEVAVTLTGLKRFRNEVSAYHALQHPNVVTLLGAFECLGRPVLVLEYARMGSLAAVLFNDATLRPDLAIQIMKSVASAVALSHDHGLLHRDLTPNNILLDYPMADGLSREEMRQLATRLRREINNDSFDSSQLAPKLSDFGLTLCFKESERFTRVTAEGELLGTPSYMSPEAISPKFGPLSVRTDIYGLGAILYRCLTGRPPFVGFNFVETMHKIIHDEVVPPRFLANHVSIELNNICMKCLERQPKDRYATTAELYTDLVRVGEGRQPKFARSLGKARKVSRWAARNRLPAFTSLLIFFFGMLVTLYVFVKDVDFQNRSLLSQYEIAARDQTFAIRGQLKTEFDSVRAVGYYMRENPDSSAESFSDFCSPLLQSHLSVKALSWVPVVAQEKKQAFEDTAPFSGGGPKRISERSDSSEIIPARTRSLYFPVQMIAPLKMNEGAVGFDLGSENGRLEALRNAARSGNRQFDKEHTKENVIVITEVIDLVQDRSGVAAVLAIHPVWNMKKARRGARDGTTESNLRMSSGESSSRPVENAEWPNGFATGVFYVVDLIEPALRDSKVSKLEFRIVDVLDGESVVYETQRLKQSDWRQVESLELSSESTSLNHFGRPWRVDFFPSESPGFGKGFPIIMNALLAMLLTILFSGLPVLYSLVSRFR